MSVEVIRRGTAVRVGDRLITGRELGRQIGRVAMNDIASASVEGDELVLGLASSQTARFSLTEASETLVIRDATLMTCDGDPSDPLELIADGALVCKAGKISWRGHSSELGEVEGATQISARGRLVTPGLIDCHTHAVFGGSRHVEFAMRARGASYQEIAASGGGIAATRAMTLEVDFADLVAATSERLDAALTGGTTTIEVKSGYALTIPGEAMLLEACEVLDSIHPIDIVSTLLGAHVVPPEHKESRDLYVTHVIGEMIPNAAKSELCTSVDVYCDEGAFTRDETRAILTAARANGLEVRAHVGQFADLGGPELLGELGALSADHLEELSPEGIAALAANGVVAVMLPTACVQLKQAPPPVDKLREAGVAMAVATDMNPGSSYCESLAVPMWLAATHYGMTVEETWLGVTRHAARALGRHDIGTLTVGARADAVVWNCGHPAEIPYRIGKNLVASVVKSGVVV